MNEKFDEHLNADSKLEGGGSTGPDVRAQSTATGGQPERPNY